jgi:hypothetical protein
MIGMTGMTVLSALFYFDRACLPFIHVTKKNVVNMQGECRCATQVKVQGCCSSRGAMRVEANLDYITPRKV